MIHMLGEQNPGIDLGHWMVKSINATNVKGCNLVFELNQKNLKILIDNHYMMLHFFLRKFQSYHETLEHRFYLESEEQ